MPILQSVTLRIRTGARGIDRVPLYAINSHEIPFDEIKGGCQSGETLDVSGSPRSFPHSLVLLGPDEGAWDIEEIDVTLHTDGEPYTVRLGAITLDGETKLNLWYECPPVLLDV